MQLNQPETPKPPTKESLEKKSKVSEYFIFLEAQSLKRFKSLQQKPFWMKFIKERIIFKLESMGLDEYDMNEELYDNFVNKMTENLFSKNKEIKPLNIDKLFQ